MTVCSLSSCRILAPDHPHPRPELRTVADPTSPPPGADSPPRPLLRRKETQLAQRGLNHQPLPMEPQGVWGRGQPPACLSLSCTLGALRGEGSMAVAIGRKVAGRYPDSQASCVGS